MTCGGRPSPERERGHGRTPAELRDATGELLVSVDVEASGPSPSTGSLVAIGACLVDEPDRTFYVEVKPLPGTAWDPDAEAVHGLSRAHLEANGAEPAAAMERFARWLEAVAHARRPVLVSFNATFDWMFVADYFHRFLGRNPFGISGLDEKAFYMGKHGVRAWAETTKRHVLERYPTRHAHTHNALDDALAQAELMRALRDQ